MILVGYLFLVGAVAWLAGARGRAPTVPLSIEASVRILGALLGTLALALGVGLLSAGSPSVLGWALLLALVLGALLYLAGTALWQARSARALRVAGWIAMAAALAVPSTLTLALPLVALPAPTLLPARADGGAAPPHGTSRPAEL